MLCQNCGQKLAKVHYTHIVNDKKVEVFLCEQCAREKNNINLSMPIDLSTFITGLMGLGSDSVSSGWKTAELICNECGMAYGDFEKTGKMGCSNCYITFREKIGPVLKRIHGSDTHTGKIPVRLFGEVKLDREIKELKAQLDKAVQNEEYERAALIRDRIRLLTKENSGHGGVSG